MAQCDAQIEGKPCDCGRHCSLPGCTCQHTYCEYGWVDGEGSKGRPCGACRPILYADWMKSLSLSISYSKLRQRQRAGDRQ